MGGLSCCAAFELNRHNAVGKKSNGRKNSQANAQGAVREGQDGDLPNVVDLSQSRSLQAPPSLQQPSRKTSAEPGSARRRSIRTDLCTDHGAAGSPQVCLASDSTREGGW